jgi:hypothetical protein
MSGFRPKAVLDRHGRAEFLRDLRKGFSIFSGAAAG